VTSPVTLPLGDVLRVATGGFHTCAITRDRALYCWGANGNGQSAGGMTSGNIGTPQLAPSVCE
jgi:alpha-tubulin suppressor-like RCC1 family protein